MPSKRKKNEARKAKKRGEEKKRKVKVKTAVSLLNPIFLLSAYARTSKTNILHLDQKASKCTTCERLYGKFYGSL